MNKCVACILESKKIKASNAPAHTCAKADKNYREPETRTKLIDGVEEKYYRVNIYDVKAETDNAQLFRLNHQYVNKYKVKRFSELWIPNRNKLPGVYGAASDLHIWIIEWWYLKLCFL